MMKSRWIALLLTILLLVALPGCSDDGAGAVFRYDFSQPVSNLDPQFTTDGNAQTIIMNCFEGLLRQNAAGAIELAAAESMEVSPDLLTYTFTLREGMVWTDGREREAPVTAKDYQFAIRRLFGPGAVSPYAAEFACIKNGQAVLNGEQSVYSLGVESPDDRTLIITLDEPYAFFERLLTTPAAMPCNEEFFKSTVGRYGLDGASVLCNGAFTIRSWNEKRLILNKNLKAPCQVLPEAVHFYIGREQPRQLLLEGKADAGVLPLELLQQAVAKRLTYQGFDNIVWSVAFNQQNELLASPGVRRSLQMALDRQRVSQHLLEGYIATEDLLPPSIMLYSQSYREAAGPALEVVYMPEAARELLIQTLAELEMEELRSLTLLVPDYGEHAGYAGLIQQMWQQNLAFYVNVEAVPDDQFTQRLNNRDYDIALLPIRSSVPEPSGILEHFVSQASGNLVGYRNPEYDALMTQAHLASLEEAVRLFSRAEDMLVDEAVVVPLYLSTSYFVTGSDVRGLEYSPYSGHIVFRNATKQ